MRAWWQRRSSRLRLAVWNLAAAAAASALAIAGTRLAASGGLGPGVEVAIGLAALAGFGVASYFVANRVLAPVRAMAERTRRLSVQAPHERLPVVNPHDDLGQLAVGFNEALARFESAYRGLDRLTADVSHELRTPLTAMRSVGEVALREQDPVRLRDALGSLLEETARMNQLIERLLLLARADNNELPVNLEAAVVSPVLADVVEVLGRVAEEKRQALRVECEEYVLAVFDAALLRLALMNLVQNAIRYSPPGKAIVVRGRRRDDGIEIEVIDEGPGIAPEHHQRVFERFYRVDRARSRAEGGVGLGLAIVKWAAERMGGTVELESAPGRGSTFRLRLRRVPE